MKEISVHGQEDNISWLLDILNDNCVQRDNEPQAEGLLGPMYNLSWDDVLPRDSSSIECFMLQ